MKRKDYLFPITCVCVFFIEYKFSVGEMIADVAIRTALGVVVCMLVGVINRQIRKRLTVLKREDIKMKKKLKRIDYSYIFIGICLLIYYGFYMKEIFLWKIYLIVLLEALHMVAYLVIETQETRKLPL